VTAVFALAFTAGATTSSAHIERASYWPDPAPDRSISPPTGGKVPKYRSLFKVLNPRRAGRTHVVCTGSVPSSRRVRNLRRAVRQARSERASRARVRSLKRRLRAAKRRYRGRVARNPSIARLRRSLAEVRRNGFKIRPTDRPRHVGQGRNQSNARLRARLLAQNERLLARCRFNSIQKAVNAARNNDYVVIMPGLYTEPESRRAPTNDPRCDGLEQQNDEGSSEAVSYAYQVKCPNDQNLIAVIGREVGPGEDPQPPRWERRGIPNLGKCIRCNVQMQGSGATPDDVVIDAGRVESGDKGPIGAKKDVAIRADRADGFVLANVKVRHAREHNIYVIESDGYLLDRFKTLYAGEYGVLTFVPDHGIMQDCQAAGHGDAGLYPGAAPETGEETIEPRPRYNQQVRHCDSHHNAAGYSSTTGNGVWVHHNNFYDNALGLTTDVFTASGHPGFPTDSMMIENNNFYSNNFNPFVEGSDVEPTIPVPVGTGMWIAGGNNHTIRNNRFWDNWRRGTMVFSVPDAFVCGEQPPANGNRQAGCDEKKISTSFRNRHHNNIMGRDPVGREDPNGTDFWWDQFPGNRNNCWFDNTGRDGTTKSITTSPPIGLPSDCASSVGTGNPLQESELLACFAEFTGEDEAGTPKGNACSWFRTPPEPR
jgi:hypothetical protein